MAKTTTFPKTTWTTLHENGQWPLKQLYITTNAGSNQMTDTFARYNDAAVEIRRLLKVAEDTNTGFRAMGARWSMSPIAHQKDSMHFNRRMALELPIQQADIQNNSNYDSKRLFMFQCGCTVKQISQVLEANGMSLKTSGASNGQTMAGCISTGVHGSALDVGSTQDYVVGINLITGPNPDDTIYIERHTKPALNDAFATKIGSKVIRNDGLFNAALVSLGSFGFIHGIVIEAEPKFLLKRYVRKIDKKVAMKLATTMDFANSSFKIDTELDANGKPLRPYHYKVFFNPYNNASEYVVEAMYKKPFTTPYPDPFTTIESSIYNDLINLLIKISQNWPRTIPFFIKRLEKSILPAVNEVSIGTLYETFWDAQYKGPAFAVSVGIDHKDAKKALKVLTDVTLKEGPIPGIFAMRFIKQSEATLSFARFPITCMLEIDGIQWKKTRKLLSLQEYGTHVIEALKQNNIPFTIHWGKNADWDYPGLVDHMFGADAQTWKKFRTDLLSPAMADVFANDFLKRIKLDQPVAIPPEDWIVSL